MLNKTILVLSIICFGLTAYAEEHPWEITCQCNEDIFNNTDIRRDYKTDTKIATYSQYLSETQVRLTIQSAAEKWNTEAASGVYRYVGSTSLGNSPSTASTCDTANRTWGRVVYSPYSSVFVGGDCCWSYWYNCETFMIHVGSDGRNWTAENMMYEVQQEFGKALQVDPPDESDALISVVEGRDLYNLREYDIKCAKMCGGHRSSGQGYYKKYSNGSWGSTYTIPYATGIAKIDGDGMGGEEDVAALITNAYTTYQAKHIDDLSSYDRFDLYESHTYDKYHSSQVQLTDFPNYETGAQFFFYGWYHDVADDARPWAECSGNNLWANFPACSGKDVYYNKSSNDFYTSSQAQLYYCPEFGWKYPDSNFKCDASTNWGDPGPYTGYNLYTVQTVRGMESGTTFKGRTGYLQGPPPLTWYNTIPDQKIFVTDEPYITIGMGLDYDSTLGIRLVVTSTDLYTPTLPLFGHGRSAVACGEYCGSSYDTCLLMHTVNYEFGDDDFYIQANGFEVGWFAPDAAQFEGLSTYSATSIRSAGDLSLVYDDYEEEFMMALKHYGANQNTYIYTHADCSSNYASGWSYQTSLGWAAGPVALIEMPNGDILAVWHTVPNWSFD